MIGRNLLWLNCIKLLFRTKAQKQVLLFKHLTQYERELSVTRLFPIVGAHIHPSVLQLGLQVESSKWSIDTEDT